MIIENGVGDKTQAKVDDENRLHTHAFTISMDTASALVGDNFIISSTLISLTSANESGILYIKNNEIDDIVISHVEADFGLSSSGVGKSTIKLILNPSTGTLISVASDADKFNSKVNASVTLAVDIFKGVEGSTVTNGDTIEFPSDGYSSISPTILTQGQALAITVKPPTSNTAMPVSVRLSIIKNGSKYGND